MATTPTTIGAANTKRRNYPVAIALAVIHIGALGVFFPIFFSWSAVWVAIGLYVLTGMGVTLVFHRLLTHRSMVVPKWFEYVLTVIGTLSLQGGPIEWVAQHRAHHAHADAEGDPHDTHHGMPWAHFEWLFRSNKDRVTQPEWARWAPDLLKDPVHRAIERYNVWLQVALAVVLYAVGGWPWVIWGIFGRLVFTYHCTWLVNSASHAVGYRTYKTTDRSTNNWWVALLTFGEGWHNNHHAFPFSARHGLRWYEIDTTYYMIAFMQKIGLAKNLKIPTQEMLERLAVKPAAPVITTKAS